ncbi:MAG: hypothetical protein GEU28_01155 [Dehalococcoidia bacterium]|nr:hypothetical protein [Dehalococcoidia bacterium]
MIMVGVRGQRTPTPRWEPRLRTTAISLAAIAFAGLIYGVFFFISETGDDDSSGGGISSAVREQVTTASRPATADIVVGEGVDRDMIESVIRPVVVASGYDRPVQLVAAAATTRPLMTVSAGADAAATVQLAGARWVPVVNFFHDADDIPLGVLQRLVRGEAAAWSELGSAVPGDVRFIVPTGSSGLAEALQVDLVSPNLEVQPADAIPALVNSDKVILALIPFAEVDHRVRSLAVDGISLTRQVGDPAAYPLVSRLSLSLGEADGQEASLRDSLVTALREAYRAEPAQTTRLLATGDIIFGRCTWTRTIEAGVNHAAFLEVGEFLEAADFTLGNMDNTLSDSIEPRGCGTGTLNFVAPTNFVEGLVYAGFDVITQGSNHVRDYGSQYVIETYEALDRHGIAHAGAGANVAEAQAAVIHEVNGVRFAIFSGVNIDVADNSPYWATADSAGSAPIDEASIAAVVESVRGQVDHVIFAPQWGTEYISGPSQSQQAMGEAALAAGVDLVVGNHPHVPQSALYNDERGFIAWSLGNFVYDQNWCYWTERSNILEAVFGDGRLLSVRYIPVKIENFHRPHIAEASDRSNVLTLVELASTGQLANDFICNSGNLSTALAPFE